MDNVIDVDANVLDWLLEMENPSVRYRTLTELLGRNAADNETAQAKEMIPESTAVRRIMEKMHPDGYWLQKDRYWQKKRPNVSEWVGDGVEYGTYASTHFCLAYLAELGMDKDDTRVRMAAERYLGLQQPDGDFLLHFSCLYGYNIRTFILLGYRDDARVQKTIELMLSTEREDGGYLCEFHEGKYKTRETKSCIRGCVKTLMAFAELPEYQEHKRCRQLVDYFLKREGLFRSSDLIKPINHDVTRTTFPITWRAGLSEILYALSKLRFGADKRLARAWKELEKKRTDEGKYILDWAPSQALLNPGKRGEANKWVTLYALLARKHARQSSM
jgi:hypothetical protein